MRPALGVAALATLITLAIAAPVLRAPSDRVFGRDIAGRHHDPFTAMEEFARPLTLSVYTQPVTAIEGTLIARAVGPAAAYNWVVLLSFPFAAAAAFLLARHLAVPRAGAAFAALAFAFSPFHLAHAAYHPQVAQVQWIPLYLLALWRCVDRPAPGAIAWLGAATVTVTLSNFYGGLIAATITPVALIAYWMTTYSRYPQPVRRLLVTLGSLMAMCVAGVAYVALATPSLIRDRGLLSFPLSDVFLHSARWWSYVMPPVAHPWFGASVMTRWTEAGVSLGIVEQQVSLGVGVVVLAIVAIVTRKPHAPMPRAIVAALVTVAAVAFACSLSPEWTIGSLSVPRPSGLIHVLAPMFRSVARFGVVVQLMAAILAGVGLSALIGDGRRRRQLSGVLLVALVIFEYAVSPAALSRDVLPTAAHRWVIGQPGRIQALDCTPVSDTSASVPWLTQDRIALLGGRFDDCSHSPEDLSQKLAAAGFTHLVVPAGSADAPAFAAGIPPGFTAGARFPDGDVLAVSPSRPMVYTEAIVGVSPREYDRRRSWRWMVTDARWTVINPDAAPILATLAVELSAFHEARRLDVRFDGRLIQSLVVGTATGRYTLGPFSVSPGPHEMTFHAVDTPQPAVTAGTGPDARRLSFAFGAWHWDGTREQR